MPVLDGKGLSWFTSLVKKYIGTPWSMSGDVNDTIVLINDNLNDYTTIGNYYCRPDADAATVSNNPAGTSFILKVYSGVGRSYDTSNGNYLTQHLEDLYGNIWIRYKSTGNWSDWSKVFTVTGDSTVGSGTNPIYLKDGVLTASSSTVGSGTKPVYLNSGAITASTSTVGSNTQPIYLNSGTLTACTSGSISAGSIVLFAGSSIPSGWLICNGSTASRTTYADLYSAIGTTYGSGNGSSTFTLPDFRNKFPEGVGDYTIGKSISASLPASTSSSDGDGYFITRSGEKGDNTMITEVSGCFTKTTSGAPYGLQGRGSGSGNKAILNLNKVSSYYGSGSAVQPASIAVYYIIKT